MTEFKIGDKVRVKPSTYPSHERTSVLNGRVGYVVYAKGEILANFGEEIHSLSGALITHSASGKLSSRTGRWFIGPELELCAGKHRRNV